MTDQQPGAHRDGSDEHNASSGLGWPLATVIVAVLISVTAVSIVNHDGGILSNTLGAIFGAIGAGSGIGAWVNSTRAAKQTNGVLDRRMAAAVSKGIAAHTQAQSVQLATVTVVPAPAAAIPAGTPDLGPATERMAAPELG